MSQRIISLFLFLILASCVSADTFNLACEDSVRLGVNAKPPIDVYSDTCVKTTDRLYDCECNNGTVILYSQDMTKEYDLVFEYEVDSVLMNKRYDNYIFTEYYSSSLFNKIMFGIIIVFVSVIIMPMLIILIVTNNNKREVKNGKD